MLFRPPTLIAPFLPTTLCRHFSAAQDLRKLKSLSKIPPRFRPRVIQEAQDALTDYLHNFRTLSFAFADNISKNSLISLSDIVSKIDFEPSSFSKSIRRFLRYHPVNEYEFFYESIGLDCTEIHRVLPAYKFFLSDDPMVFNVACALYGFGFPWNRLGMLYKEEKSIFDKSPCEIYEMMSKFREDYGFNTVTLIGICLVFPRVLVGNWGTGRGNIDGLFDDLRRLFIDFDLVSAVEGNVDAWIDVCRKIHLFYDLGCKKGKIGELMGQSKHIFVEHPLETLAEKIEFFCRLDVEKEDVGMLLLSKPEIFSFDLKNPVICSQGIMRHFGLQEKELNLISESYPYVLGRNRMANLPHVMRLVELNRWFFNQIKTGKHHLLCSYLIDSLDEGSDKDFKDNLVTIQSSRTPYHTLSKLEFLHAIGFGENKWTIKVLKHMHGTSSDLQERFDCLIRSGIGFSRLCKMISVSPKILNQQSEFLEKKVKFLCQDIGSSLQYLDVFPTYLCFDLEKRIKPRFRFHLWLKEMGLCGRVCSLSSIIATSEKTFIARIYKIHPAAPKKWLEEFSNKCCDTWQET